MSIALDMFGHIDDAFRSVPATRSEKGGAYVDGIWQETPGAPVAYTINTQPASDKEIDFLVQGGERITEARRVYVNSGDLNAINLKGEWDILGVKWKEVQLDNRPWNNYCKAIVVRLDDQ